MPTSAEFQELFDNCDFVQADGTTVIDAGTTDKRVTVNGVVGIYLKSKINGNLLFFACSGHGGGSSWSSRGSLGGFWSSSFYSARNAYRMNFYSGGVNPQRNDGRYDGFPVRPVFGAGLRSTNRSLLRPIDDERLEREVDDSRFIIKNERDVQE